MPRFKVAHIREQGNDMIIFPLESSFGRKASDEQNSILAELQARARAAGLQGTAAAVWESGGRMFFLAPTQWRGFFSSIDLRFVLANVNREISW
jgi:hypothetical protein